MKQRDLSVCNRNYLAKNSFKGCSIAVTMVVSLAIPEAMAYNYSFSLKDKPEAIALANSTRSLSNKKVRKFDFQGQEDLLDFKKPEPVPREPVETPSQNETAPAPSPSNNTQVLNLIKEFEGFKAAAYLDTDGTPVIGYGMSKINGRKVRLGDRISKTDADAALRKEIDRIHQKILAVTKVELNSNQLGALVSFAFNVGTGALAQSTLIKKLNAEDYQGAAAEFLRWNKAKIGGKMVVLEGLSRRRLAEKQLFLAPSVPK